MKTYHLSKFIVMILTLGPSAMADATQQRISIAPGNDLTPLIHTEARGARFGSSVCGGDMSKEFQEGYRIATKNDHHGKRNILVIDDGKSTYPTKDEETGLPVVILTNARITKELQDLVRGYNSSTLQSFKQRRKNEEARRDHDTSPPEN
jgi:hypothetical protein